jgi:uncharacterized damage-inducible protein DinB
MRLVAAHLEWADRQVLDALAPLAAPLWSRPLPSSHGSLLGTAAHLFGAEWTWLERVRGRSPAQVGPPGGVADPDDLLSRWPAVWEGWREVADTADPGAVVAYRTTAGAPHATPLAHVLLHVALHSAQYRGQVAAMLRSLGLTAPGTDLIAYLRRPPSA